ncbi:TPD1 protein homolog 1-like [Macadamia integrifolia]|uniref:TPD1 protein homolog 1-like n=1 Tax=Macadamia integrifolia TaxID=60698 RepID=UPI001C531466|nr:TPD1 protein homolog 1-like [Macadamia integrifolia]
MAETIKLFRSLLLLFFIFGQGYGQQCSKRDLSIKLNATGKSIGGKPEFILTISNNCVCPQSNVLIRCFGLSTVEPVDPAICKPVDNNNCLINNGTAIVKGHPISFKYAWLIPTDFSVVNSTVVCS